MQAVQKVFRGTLQGVSPSISRAGRHRLAMDGVSVVGFLAEVQIRRAQLLSLTQEQISTRLKIKMQSFHQCDPLCAGKLGQYIHAEDAIESSDIDRLGQIHRVERH